MRIFLYTLLTIMIMTSCNISRFQKGIKGNGNMITKELSINDYSSISIGGRFDLVYTLTVDAKPYIRIEIDENLVDYVTTTVKDNRLTIGSTTDINPKHYKIYTNSTSISEISASGVNNIELKDSIYSENIQILASGVGNITAKNLHCQNINIDMSGVTNITLKGETKNANMNISGKSNINAYELKTQIADCSVSGIGDIDVYVSDKLTANVSGIGKIRYKGDPKEKQLSSSGIGSIKEKK